MSLDVAPIQQWIEKAQYKAKAAGGEASWALDSSWQWARQEPRATLVSGAES